jgi:hypothetical protein
MHARFENYMKILWGVEQRGVDYQVWTLIKYQHNASSHLIMVIIDYCKMFWYLPSGHNALDSLMSFIIFIDPL